jgi:hypothetical protein
MSPFSRKKVYGGEADDMSVDSAGELPQALYESHVGTKSDTLEGQ